MANVLVSVPWTWSFGDPPLWLTQEADVRLIPRSRDWGLSRSRARVLLILDAITLARQVDDADAVVLATLGAEAGLFARLIRRRAKKARVVVFDFLAPRRELPSPLATSIFSSVDRFLVIRTGDRVMLRRRFGVPEERSAFLRWPVRPELLPVHVSDGDYVYAAGWAHRDWPTLVRALAQTGLSAVLAPGRPLEVPEEARHRVTVLADMPTPDEGRRLTAGARIVAVVMSDTDLPSGPLVLLDALAAGKAVVATDVNGTRDYVEHGHTALVVPPGDVTRLANALEQLASDAGLRARLGDAARVDTLERSVLDRFWRDMISECL